jgi:hypothetical protein
MSSRLLHALIVLIASSAALLSAGCHRAAQRGEAQPGSAAESTFAGEASSVGDVDAVPILSIIGQPLTQELQPNVPPPTPSPVSAVIDAADPSQDRMISVVAGSEIWFEMLPKKKGQRWYRGFTIQLVGSSIETILGPELTPEQVIEAPNGTWTWTEQSPPTSGNNASPRVIEIPTLGLDEPGVYLAVFEITPYQPLNNSRRDAYPLERIGVLIVQP